jgi:toxin-antitoxin system PIN domain toxin
VALAWPTHVHHRLAQEWFASKRELGFRTCPMTQAGFVRITSNPSFSPQAVPVRAAIALLGEIVRLPEHGFWADDLSFPQAAPKEMPIVSHRQVTDAYLISLAEAHGGMVATLDRGMLALGKTGLVEIAG